MGTLRFSLGFGVTLLAIGLLPMSSCVVRERLGGEGEGGAAGEGNSSETISNTSGTAGSDASVLISGVSCDWATSLKKSCAISVCHGTREPFAGLNLSPDAALVARIKDVAVTLRDLDCDPTEGYMACTTPPPECTADIGAKIVDSANPNASYILMKMSGTHSCGNQMPLEPGNSPSAGWGDERRACIEELVRAVAAL